MKAGIPEISHKRDDVGPRDRLSVAYRQCTVLIGLLANFLGHEFVSRHLLHDRQDGMVDANGSERSPIVLYRASG